MLPRAQIRSDKLYCFTILTPFDSLWVYKSKRLKKKKKKGLQLKKHERYGEREKEKKKLASCDSRERPS